MELKEFDRRILKWAEESVKQFKTIAKETGVPIEDGGEMAYRLHEWAVDMFLPEELGYIQ